MSSRARLFVCFLVGALILLIVVAALWFVVRGQGGTIDAPVEPKDERTVERVILGLAPIGEALAATDVPLFLQLDLRAHPSRGAAPPPDLIFGSETKPWWIGIQLILDPGTRDERNLAFDVLRPRDPVRIDLARGSAYLAVALAPDTLVEGPHALAARFEWAGKVVARSNKCEVDVGAASIPQVGRSLLLARYYLEMEQPEKVLESLDLISDRETTHPDVFGLRGEALEMQGDLHGALEAYNRAIELIALRPEKPAEPPTYYLHRRRELMGIPAQRRQP